MRMTMGVLAGAGGAAPPVGGTLTVGTHLDERGYSTIVDTFGSVTHPLVFARFVWTTGTPSRVGGGDIMMRTNVGSLIINGVTIDLSTLVNSGAGLWTKTNFTNFGSNFPTTNGATVAYQLVGVPGI